jgi:hypothetical protein
MEVGEFTAPGWRSGPVSFTDSFWQRWRGIDSVPPGCGALIPGSSVHGWGLPSALLTIGIDRAGLVLACRRLSPRTIVWIRGAAFVLELADGGVAPAVGDSLTWEGVGPFDPLRQPFGKLGRRIRAALIRSG